MLRAASFPPSGSSLRLPQWHILVVDNDPEVHTSIRVALTGLTLFGRSLALVHAKPDGEVRPLLLGQRDFALVVLTLEAGDADNGQSLIPFIRHTAGMRSTQIVLRTGQPDQIPDLETLLQYDVHDYRTKSELTQDRWQSLVVKALHSYQQHCALEATLLHNRGLQERLHSSAYHDPLVQLPNRAHFIEKVDKCVRTGMHGQLLALLDIDDFSTTNDVMGHRFGDRLLDAVARRLSDTLPASALLARVGGDTFGIFGAAQEIQPQRLLECVRQPLTLDGALHKVSLTCGYVLLARSTRPGDDLVKDATIALKRAKRDHRGRHLQYSAQMGAEARERAALLTKLHAAIESDELFLVYQPKILLDSGTLTGVEALLRWRTKDGNLVPPDQFIPMAEHSGLIVALGQWVLTTACRTMRALLDAGLAPQRMAINVSTVQLRDPGFLEAVCTALASHGLQGSHLELEITESVAALPTQLLELTLTSLRAQGVSIAIDDFGTGYSSLSYLERLPLDRIKIDRAFVRQLGEPQGARIAEMVVQLGRKLGLQVLAEGIEDQATLQALQAMGCHEGQGYFIARPMEQAQLTQWLTHQA